MKKVLILGANGFVGTHLAQYLSEKNHIIRMSYSENLKNSDSNFIKVNAREKLSIQLQKAYEKFPFETIIYTWGAINSSESHMKETYIKRIEEVVAFMNQKSIALIFFSAGSVIRDISKYAQYNLRSEEIIKKSTLQKWIILRPTLIYGPGDNKNLTFILRMAKLSPILLLPQKNQVLIRPIFIRDLMQIVQRIIENDLYPNNAFLISGKEFVDLRDYIETFLTEIKKKPIIISINLRYIKNIIRKIHQKFSWLPLEQFSNSSDDFSWPHTNEIGNHQFTFTPPEEVLKDWVKVEFLCQKN